MNNLREVWRLSLKEAASTLEQFLLSPDDLVKCVQFSDLLTRKIRNGGRIYICGNGGSQCDAMHFAMQMTGRYRQDRKPMGALALGDSSHVTCVANDYGFEYIFSRQVSALISAQDVLIGLSTSGQSLNVSLAMEAARKMGASTVALLSRDGGKIKSQVDLAIVVPAQTSDRIQEMHKKILLIAIENIERELFPEHYV
jgi:D-sedoheptulose 7-phosphate isomerase